MEERILFPLEEEWEAQPLDRGKLFRQKKGAGEKVGGRGGTPWRMAGMAGNSTQSFAVMMDTVAPPLGAIFSSGLAFGPMAAVMEARKAGSLGDVNSDVFPVLFVNCIAWAIYGKMTSERPAFSSFPPLSKKK